MIDQLAEKSELRRHEISQFEAELYRKLYEVGVRPNEWTARVVVEHCVIPIETCKTMKVRLDGALFCVAKYHEGQAPHAIFWVRDALGVPDLRFKGINKFRGRWEGDGV